MLEAAIKLAVAAAVVLSLCFPCSIF